MYTRQGKTKADWNIGMWVNSNNLWSSGSVSFFFFFCIVVVGNGIYESWFCFVFRVVTSFSVRGNGKFNWNMWFYSSYLYLLTGIDQYDRDSIINDFKNGTCKLLVATSVAARGLDVKHLILVVNYSCPNHYEDYVHRAGRTGRAGNKVKIRKIDFYLY